MKNKLFIITGVGVVLVAAVFLYSIGRFTSSQRTLNQGLWNACKYDNAAAASYWLAKGADVNARDNHGVVALRKNQTALHLCAHFASTKTVELLLLVGADPNAADEQGSTPLFFCNFAKVADKLVSFGADVNHKDKNGDTALQARRMNGWHLDDELKAVLEGNGPSAKMRRDFEQKHGSARSGTYPPTKGNFVKNLKGHGTARVWGIMFDVIEPVGHASGSSFEGGLHSDPEKTDARNNFYLGDDVKIRLEKVPGRPITFELNGNRYGTLEPGDKVSIDKERSVKVNATIRKPAPTTP
ncbi:MAG: ankyrin repeat domain-containing protein [Limisphaerales bacterium]